jgi:hypothetical protein
MCDTAGFPAGHLKFDLDRHSVAMPVSLSPLVETFCEKSNVWTLSQKIKRTDKIYTNVGKHYWFLRSCVAGGCAMTSAASGYRREFIFC